MQNVEIREKYDKLAEEFSKKEYTNFAEYMEHRANLVLNWGKPINDGDTILELGCGDGYFAYYLLKMNKMINYIATDISENMLKKTKERCSLIKNVNITTIKLDINDIPKLEELPKVDICIGFLRTFFHYAEHPLEILKVLRQKVKKKIILDFNPREFNEKEIIEILTKAGFNNVKIRGFFIPQKKNLNKLFIKGLIYFESNSLIRKIITKRKFNCIVKGEII